jgi:hypothetical protein
MTQPRLFKLGYRFSTARRTVLAAPAVSARAEYDSAERARAFVSIGYLRLLGSAKLDLGSFER